MISSILDRFKPEAENDTFELIKVKAHDLRSIAICAISRVKKPHILLDGKAVTDYSDSGPLKNENLEQVRNLEIRDGKHPVMGFHSGHTNMWFCADYKTVLDQCRANGWVE